MLLSEDCRLSISIPKTLVRLLFKLNGSLCWLQKATKIVVILTESFSGLFEHENLIFDWSSTGSVSRQQCEHLIPTTRSSGLLLKLSGSLCCHRKATEIVVILTKRFSLLFAPENLMFDCISTCSGVKIAA